MEDPIARLNQRLERLLGFSVAPEVFQAVLEAGESGAEDMEDLSGLASELLRDIVWEHLTGDYWKASHEEAQEYAKKNALPYTPLSERIQPSDEFLLSVQAVIKRYSPLVVSLDLLRSAMIAAPDAYFDLEGEEFVPDGSLDTYPRGILMSVVAEKIWGKGWPTRQDGEDAWKDFLSAADNLPGDGVTLLKKT